MVDGFIDGFGSFSYLWWGNYIYVSYIDVLLIIFGCIMYHDDPMYGLQQLLNILYHFMIILMLVTIGMLMMAISFCER